MELAHNDPFGSIDDKGPLIGHQGNLTEIDLLLLDVLDAPAAGFGIEVPQNQLHGHLEGSRVGHTTLPTLIDIVLGLTEAVAHEFQAGRLVEVLDRKHGLKNSLESHTLAPVRWSIFLEEKVVRIPLDLDQIGKIDDLLRPAKTAAQS